MQTSRRVLVVDDEASVRVTLAANLEMEGYEVIEARDGAHAIELVSQQSFALVISDVRMPGLDGVETFRRIKRLQPELPVVLMTAFAVEKLIEEGIREGVYTVVYKPFSVDHIVRLVARAVTAHRVLVVDDLPSFASSVEAALQEAGLEAEAVHDGRSAIQRIRESPIDVCVIDLIMPNLDGLKTCEEIRKYDDQVIVIIMTGHLVPDMVRAVMKKGGYACLRKPFNMHELMRTIARARGEPAMC